MSTNRFLRIIETLCLHEVRFIIVGGVAAVLQRVPINTTNFDIVHEREHDNVLRLLEALAVLGVTQRGDPRKLMPTQSDLLAPESHLLRTDRLDLGILGSIDDGLGYAELIHDTDKIEVTGFLLDVLKLEKLIETKRKMTRPRDRFLLIHLEATLEERERLSQEDDDKFTYVGPLSQKSKL